jgi:hypothetical protein
MPRKLKYDFPVQQLNRATAAGFGLVLFVLGSSILLLTSTASAQVNGMPASVTSPGFGGHQVNGVALHAGVSYLLLQRRSSCQTESAAELPSPSPQRLVFPVGRRGVRSALLRVLQLRRRHCRYSAGRPVQRWPYDF